MSAYLEGYIAYRNGETKNPHNEGTPEWTDWEVGFTSAELEDFPLTNG